MAAPTPPTGVVQAELDAMFAELKIAGEAKRQTWMKSQVPAELQPHFQYSLDNSSNTAAVVSATGNPVNGKGILTAIIVNTLGSGTLTVNDAPSVGASNANNEIFSRATGDMTAGKVIMLGDAYNVGLSVSAFPAGGNYTLVYFPTPAS